MFQVGDLVFCHYYLPKGHGYLARVREILTPLTEKECGDERYIGNPRYLVQETMYARRHLVAYEVDMGLREPYESRTAVSGKSTKIVGEA